MPSTPVPPQVNITAMRLICELMADGRERTRMQVWVAMGMRRCGLHPVVMRRTIEHMVSEGLLVRAGDGYTTPTQESTDAGTDTADR
jgi:hypothetical protein